MRALVFSPNGKHLVSVSDDKTMRIWDLSNGRCLKVVDCHSHFVTCVAWGRGSVPASDGQQAAAPINVVATGSVDLCAKVWAP